MILEGPAVISNVCMQVKDMFEVNNWMQAIEMNIIYTYGEIKMFSKELKRLMLMYRNVEVKSNRASNDADNAV